MPIHMLRGEQTGAPVKTGKLGIRKLAGLHYYVRDLERSRRFYVECMGFAEVGRSSSGQGDRGPSSFRQAM